MLAGDTNRIRSALALVTQTFGAYRLHILLIAVIGFFSGILEGVGINAIIPLFSFINGTAVSSDRITGMITRLFSLLPFPMTAANLMVFMVCLFLLKGMLLFFANVYNGAITSSYERNTRARLFALTLRSEWTFLLSQKLGHLEKIIQDHVGYAANALMYFGSSILLMTSLAMYIVVALNISYVITAATLIIGAVLFLIFKPYLYKTKKLSQRFLNANKDAAHLINEHIIGMKTVKAYAAEETVYAKGADLFTIEKNTRYQMSMYSAGANAFLQPISFIFILVVFGITYRTPQFNIASFAVIVYLVQRIFSYLQTAYLKLQSIQEIIPYVRSIAEFQQRAGAAQEPAGAQPLSDFQKLSFQKVGFSYIKGTPVLNNVTFEIKKGETVGLIGPSGAGKTTIIDLILGLLRPASGNIEVNNVALDNYNKTSWRSHIAYVAQDMFVLNGAVEDNIRFYRDAITLEMIKRAAELAQIDRVIAQMPKQYKTEVGDRGLTLSVGQRQRVILARALAGNPSLLILDESTSALDSESEEAVQRALETLRGTLTMFIVAHRLSTIERCDRLMVIDQGAIQEEGSPAALLKNEHSYFYKVHALENN